MKNSVFIMALEPLESRYTAQWETHLPKIINEFLVVNKLDSKYEVHNICPIYLKDKISKKTTAGAFLNFIDTNIWKNEQVNILALLFQQNKIKDGDKIIFTDAWNSGILQIKYMSELLGIDVEIHSLFHAGSYDPQDFLGRIIKDKRWSKNAERSFYYASTKNYFATKFHSDLFHESLDVSKWGERRSIIAGFPFEYLKETLKPYKNLPKENIILFPHRIAPEKQVGIFRDLAKELPEFKFVICQEENLTKHEYHTLLGASKMVFSANLQETLGISCYEGALVNSIPFVPDRLSYQEMYPDEVKYGSFLTESFENYLNFKETLKVQIRSIMNMEQQALNNYCEEVIKQTDKFFNSENLLKEIFL